MNRDEMNEELIKVNARMESPLVTCDSLVQKIGKEPASSNTITAKNISNHEDARGQHRPDEEGYHSLPSC